MRVVSFKIDPEFEIGVKHIAAGTTDYIAFNIEAFVEDNMIFRVDTAAQVIAYRVPNGYKTEYEWINMDYEGNGEAHQLIEVAADMAVTRLKRMDE